MDDTPGAVADHTASAIMRDHDNANLRSVLRSFAQQHGLNEDFGFQSPDRQWFLVELAAPGAHLTVTNPFQQHVFEIYSYTDRTSGKSAKTSTELMDLIVARLKQLPGTRVEIAR